MGAARLAEGRGIIASVNGGTVQDKCDMIVDQASYMWKVEEGNYRDDITVIVLMLPWLRAGPTATTVQ